MPDDIIISKSPPPFPSMDFAALREAGIKHFEKMGSRLWTDYNLHDPGITILEVLCWAITDLGYRTSFPIEDLLASGENAADQKQYFEPLEILTCNPVTVNDFRKILIDVDGIKNAWLVKTKQEMKLWVNGIDEKYLSFNDDGSAYEIQLNGLYDVYIDLEDDIDQDDMDAVDDIVQGAWQTLWKHRNLCEDYVSVNVIGEMEFSIDVKVELCDDADINNVAGDIFYFVQEFLTPTLQFYSFKEMYEDRRKSCDDIFDGPVLCNGFIDDEELDKAQLRTVIYKSDLWQVIMDVCGVAGIKKLSITTTDDWCLPITAHCKPKLNIDCERISLQQGFNCIHPGERKVEERIELQKKLHRPVKKTNQRPPLQTGINRDINEYFSIQDDLPGTYKIGDGQVTGNDGILRHAQVHQLKGYLLLFDELLANYLLQLSKVKNLLSVSQPEDHSYFYHTLYHINGVKDLLKAFPPEGKDGTDDEWKTFTENEDNDYIKQLKKITETETGQKQRKNIFLDHLLARFGETFSAYAMKVYEEQCNCSSTSETMQVDAEGLKHKAAFLKKIPVLSSERGKAFNYKALDCGNPDIWDTWNVEGVKKRVCMYLGIADYKRKTLTCPPEFAIKPSAVYTDGRMQGYMLRLEDKDGNILLHGLKEYRLQQNALKDAKDIREQLLQGNISEASGRVMVKDRENNIALQSDEMDAGAAEELINKIETLAYPECCGKEGFHIVEHILLRPKDDDYTPLLDPVEINANGNVETIEDVYSCWITVIVPDWLPQFRGKGTENENARYQFEQLVRRETPAHIFVRFCWKTPKQMYLFETTYLKWLYENALAQPNERELTEHTNDLVELLKTECPFDIREMNDPCT